MKGQVDETEGDSLHMIMQVSRTDGKNPVKVESVNFVHATPARLMKL